MKKIFVIVVVVSLMFICNMLFFVLGILAQEESRVFSDFFKDNNIVLGVSVTMDFWDKYVWRGQYLDRDNVLQPGFSVSAKGFTFGYWSSFDMENQDGLNSDESDYYISYTYELKPLSFTAGHTWYDFPEANSSSKEYSLAVAWDTLFTPTLSFTHDYEDGKQLNTEKDGNYLSLSVSHSIALNQKYGVSLDISGVVGYIDGQWLSGEGGHFTPTVGLTLPIIKSLTCVPTIGYNIPFGDLSDNNIGNQDSKFFGGVKMSASF